MGFTDPAACEVALQRFSGDAGLAAELLAGGDLSVEAAEVIGGRGLGYQFGAEQGLRIIEQMIRTGKVDFRLSTAIARGAALVGDRRVYWVLNRVIVNGFLKQFWNTTIDDKMAAPGIGRMWRKVFEELTVEQKADVEKLRVASNLEAAIQLYYLADGNLREAWMLRKQVG
jgi:hypothetical protein